MSNVQVLRIFVDEQGKFGDIAPVVIDEGRKLADEDRQALMKKLNVVEAAFVNDIAGADVSFMHVQGELDFAGVPALGAAWLLARFQQKPIAVIKSRGGDIIVSHVGELTWVRADLGTMPPWHHKQFKSAEEVERLDLQETSSWKHVMVWAWIDEAKGLIRARTFAPDWGIPEAQGNGSGSILLAAKLDRNIEIKHGDGSVIFAKPAPDNCAELGGRVVELK